MIIAIISTICGVVLLFNPFAGAVWIMRIVGVFISVYAVLDFISTYIIKKNVEQFQVILDSETVEAENSRRTRMRKQQLKKQHIKKRRVVLRKIVVKQIIKNQKNRGKKTFLTFFN